MKLSIIVAVYDVAETLERCVQSILGQDFGDFELLLVDDGSTDGSGLLADRLAQTDARLAVFHKANGGLSSARNHGLDHACGEYLTFVDGDDELSPGTLSAVMALAGEHPEYDMIEYPVTERPGRADCHVFNPGRRDYADALDWLAEKGFSHCWACNKVYRRGLFGGVRFPVGRRFEDVIATGLLLMKRPRIATTGRGMYLYHWNGGGITARSRSGGLTELLEAQIETVRKLDIDTHERRWHGLYLDMFTAQLHAYRATGRLTLEGQRVAVSRRYHGTKPLLKALALNLLGLKTACRLFKIARK